MFYSGSFDIDVDDLGDTFKLEGVLIGNGHDTLAMLMPEAKEGVAVTDYWKPTTEQMEDWVKQTDDPIEKLYTDQTKTVVKAIIRKATRQLDQTIVWRTYYRDNYTCIYCGIAGVPLTYDHFLAQAFGGQTTLANGRTSCRPCNKAKGHMTIDEWKQYCRKENLNDGETI